MDLCAVGFRAGRAARHATRNRGGSLGYWWFVLSAATGSSHKSGGVVQSAFAIRPVIASEDFAYRVGRAYGLDAAILLNGKVILIGVTAYFLIVTDQELDGARGTVWS